MLSALSVVDISMVCRGFLGGSDSEEAACNTGDTGLIPWVRKIPWRRECYPLQYLAWKIPWTEEPSGLQFMVSQ